MHPLHGNSSLALRGFAHERSKPDQVPKANSYLQIRSFVHSPCVSDEELFGARPEKSIYDG